MLHTISREQSSGTVPWRLKTKLFWNKERKRYNRTQRNSFWSLPQASGEENSTATNGLRAYRSRTGFGQYHEPVLPFHFPYEASTGTSFTKHHRTPFKKYDETPTGLSEKSWKIRAQRTPSEGEEWSWILPFKEILEGPSRLRIDFFCSNWKKKLHWWC